MAGLVRALRAGDYFLIGQDIRVHVVECRTGRVWLQADAPREFNIKHVRKGEESDGSDSGVRGSHTDAVRSDLCGLPLGEAACGEDEDGEIVVENSR